MDRPLASKRNSAMRRNIQPPLCEGWLDKYALCRGMFTAKGWHRRYVFITYDGIGFCHKNPREKGNYPANRPLKSSVARTFIPFARKRHGEVELEPVYLIDDVSAARHPAVPQQSHNGICSEAVSTEEGSLSASAKDTTKTNGTAATVASCSCTYYYFGISFEEHQRRYLLLLRTDSPQEYMKWTIILPLYVNEGSATQLVPLSHPLEVGRPQPIDVNRRRLTNRRESTLQCSIPYYFDPDPCTADEYAKVRRMCLNWDEGEWEHLFQWAANRVECMCRPADSAATESLAEQQVQSEEAHRRDVARQFDVLGPSVPSYEMQHSPHSKEYNMESSVLQLASPDPSRHTDAVDIMADDVSATNRSKSITHTFAPAPDTATSQRKQQYQRQRGKNRNGRDIQSDSYSAKSAHGASV